MPRVTIDGETFHPDQLDPITGRPREEVTAPEPPSPAQLLEEAGATRRGSWWDLPVTGEDGEPVKVLGAANALEELRRLEG